MLLLAVPDHAAASSAAFRFLILPIDDPVTQVRRAPTRWPLAAHDRQRPRRRARLPPACCRGVAERRRARISLRVHACACIACARRPQITSLKLGLPAVVTHAVTPRSPLYNLSLSDMEEQGMEILCVQPPPPPSSLAAQASSRQELPHQPAAHGARSAAARRTRGAAADC